MSCDVTKDDSLHNPAQDIVNRYGRFDVLVTSAGIQARGALSVLDATTLRHCLDVNASEPSSRARLLCP